MIAGNDSVLYPLKRDLTNNDDSNQQVRLINKSTTVKSHTNIFISVMLPNVQSSGTRDW